MLDESSAYIAILDKSGAIVGVNSAWRQFADAIRLACPDHGVGSDYLTVFRKATVEPYDSALIIAAGFRELLAGCREEFLFEYACRGEEEEERWFVMRATPLCPDKTGILVSHEEIPTRGETEEVSHGGRDSASPSTLRERRRIAADLHDGVVQDLCACRAKLAALHESLSNTDHSPALKEIGGLVEQAIRDIRSQVLDSTRPSSSAPGIAQTMKALAEELGQRYGYVCEVLDDGSSKRLDDVAATVLRRGVRELLVNVGKHARARRVTVSLRRIADRLAICVEDDGLGFDRSIAGDGTFTEGGFGLLGIGERLKPVGGRLEIDSTPGQGTRVTVTAPLGRTPAERRRRPRRPGEAGVQE